MATIELARIMARVDEIHAAKTDRYTKLVPAGDVVAHRAVAVEDAHNDLLSATRTDVYTVVTPRFWTTDENFQRAGLLLPSLCDPTQPPPHEPGDQLQAAAWLTLNDLQRPVSVARSGCLTEANR